MFVLAEEYYPDDSQEEGPSVTNVLRDHCHKMGQIMLDNVTTKTSLDVESKVSSTIVGGSKLNQGLVGW